jgi:hypothetical protein
MPNKKLPIILLFAIISFGSSLFWEKFVLLLLAEILFPLELQILLFSYIHG